MNTTERAISIGDLSMPLSFVTSGTTILGQPETGKTNLCRVIAESVMDAGVPVCIIDPKGDYWGLRIDAQSTNAAYPITIFGGDHGDLALTEDAGKIIADVLVDTRAAMILDLSHLESDSARGRFVTAFCKRLYFRKREATFPLLVIVDEIDLFAPQNPMGDQKQVLHAVVQLRKLGRKRGIGVCGNAQRSSRIHKDLVEMSDLLVVTQLSGRNDTAMLSDVLKYQMTTTDLSATLRVVSRLPKGQAYFYSPAKFAEVNGVRGVPLAHTFDSSRTPEVGDEDIAAEVKPLDIGAIRAAIEEAGATVETDDLDALKAEIERLKRAPVIERTREVRVPILDDDDRKMLIGVENLLRRVSDLMRMPGFTVTGSKADTERLAREMHPNGMTRREPLASVGVGAETPLPDEAEAVANREAFVSGESAALASLRAVPALARMRAVLEEVFPRKLSREALAFFAGYKPSGGAFRGALKTLRDAGEVKDDPTGIVIASRKATERPPKTNAELVEWAKTKLNPAQLRLFELLWAAPSGIPTWELATASSYNASGGAFRGALKALRDAGLVTRQGDLYQIVTAIR